MIRLFAAGLAALLALAAGARAEGWSQKVAVGQAEDAALKGWPAVARSAARVMKAKYGRPDEITEDAVIWFARGPWAKTIVRRRPWPRYTLGADRDFIVNVVSYRVPVQLIDELARFDEKLYVDRAYTELSSCAAREELNFLTLNLADEIVRGKRTSDEARELYARIARLADSGKSSPYLRGLLFAPRRPPPTF